MKSQEDDDGTWEGPGHDPKPKTYGNIHLSNNSSHNKLNYNSSRERLQHVENQVEQPQLFTGWSTYHPSKVASSESASATTNSTFVMTVSLPLSSSTLDKVKATAAAQQPHSVTARRSYAWAGSPDESFSDTNTATSHWGNQSSTRSSLYPKRTTLRQKRVRRQQHLKQQPQQSPPQPYRGLEEDDEDTEVYLTSLTAALARIPTPPIHRVTLSRSYSSEDDASNSDCLSSYVGLGLSATALEHFKSYRHSSTSRCQSITGSLTTATTTPNRTQLDEMVALETLKKKLCGKQREKKRKDIEQPPPQQGGATLAPTAPVYFNRIQDAANMELREGNLKEDNFGEALSSGEHVVGDMNCTGGMGDFGSRGGARGGGYRRNPPNRYTALALESMWSASANLSAFFWELMQYPMEVLVSDQVCGAEDDMCGTRGGGGGGVEGE